MESPTTERSTIVGRGPGRLAVLLVVLVAITATSLIVLRTGGAGDSSSGSKSSTDPARFDLPALTGAGHVRLANFAGKPLVVNFFASWCTACRGELPGFLKVQAGLHGAVNRHMHVITLASAGILLVFGLLLATGRFTFFNRFAAQSLFDL